MRKVITFLSARRKRRRITTFGYFVIRTDEGESAVRPMCAQRRAAIVTAMNPLVPYLVVVATAVAIALGTMMRARPMARCCPGCDADVRLDARACSACGYAFT